MKEDRQLEAGRPGADTTLAAANPAGSRSDEARAGEGEASEEAGCLLAADQVQRITGLSRTTLWRLRKKGEFPDPIRLSSQKLRWRQSELMTWLATRDVCRLPATKA